MNSESKILEKLYRSVNHKFRNQSENIILIKNRKHLDLIIEHSENKKAVLAVLITLMLKKLISPKQDIRKHQAGMADGFSGRSLDTKIVTPFLKKHDFPYMEGGSGWLTRSLEQAHPYNKKYPGKISPQQLRKAFLEIVHAVQCLNLEADKVLIFLLAGLAEQRNRNTTLRLSRPINLSIQEIVERLKFHFSSLQKGTSRLPVLAVYAIYKQMMKEMERYKTMTLLELKPHTAADRKTGLLGDIQIINAEGHPIEIIEIKHNIAITAGMLEDCYKKFRKTPIKTFYLLSTKNVLPAPSDLQRITDDVRKNHGCRVIVNGVNETLTYYLRLIKDTALFINDYVSLVEQDPEISYALKKNWNELCDS